MAQINKKNQATHNFILISSLNFHEGRSLRENIDIVNKKQKLLKEFKSSV